MKTLITLLTIIFLLPYQSSLNAGIYEGFDMSAPSGSSLGNIDSTLSGKSSTGWHSSWQTAKGKALLTQGDLAISGYASTPGAIIIKGERKEKSIGQGIAIRQIDADYTGDVYGSFRFSSGNLIKDSVLGILFSIPNAEAPTPRNSFFAFCPKRWGSIYGLLSAGQSRTSKIENGIECYPDETYLLIWKLENLPFAGKRNSIGLKMWILDNRQATYFAENGLTQESLEGAEIGSDPNDISQRADTTLANSKRGIFKGLILSCFSSGLARVSFDEIRVSKDSLATAVGLLSED